MLEKAVNKGTFFVIDVVNNNNNYDVFLPLEPNHRSSSLSSALYRPASELPHNHMINQLINQNSPAVPHLKLPLGGANTTTLKATGIMS